MEERMTAPDTYAISDEDKAAIREQSRKYVETSLARDYQSWVKLATTDAVFMPPGAPRVEGRDTLLEWAKNLPQTKELTVTPVDIEGLGDLAFVRGTYTFAFVPPGAELVSMRGSYIEIWKKQTDGSWLIHRDIWNSDQPAD
jgi:uncharacterized protein (TIGR02246 family)